MKRFGMALILTGVLSLPAFAGDVPTIGKASPSPSPAPTTQSTTSTSGIGTAILLIVFRLIR